jgi:vitamin B12 transporter
MQRLVAAALLLLPAATATAASEILVTGRPLPGPEPPSPGLLLDAEALATPAGRLDSALGRVPGLALFRRASSASASQTAQGLTLRGLGGNAATRMLVTLDGVPQTDLFAGWVAFVPLSAEPLGSARVVAGAGGARLFGALGAAGTLALQSALPETRLEVRAGSRGGVELATGLALPTGAGVLGLAARHVAGDGHLLVDPALAGAADVPARYRQTAGSARLVAPLGAETELQARLSGFSDRRLRGAREGRSDASGGDAALRLVHRGRWGAEAVAFAQLRDLATRAVSLDPARQSASVTLDQFATPASGVGLGLLLRPPVPPSADLALGLDWRRAGGRARERFNFVGGIPRGLREAGGRQEEASLIADLALRPASGLALGASARLQRWRLEGGVLRETSLATGALLREEIAPNRDGAAWAGALGFSWRPQGAEALRLHAAASRGIRLPTLNELHRPFRIGNDVTGPNPLLEPERIGMAEAGLAWTPLHGVGAELLLFAARLEGAIANVTLGTGPGVFPGAGFVPAGGVARQRRNIGALATAGLEARARVVAGDLRLEGALARVRARVEGGADAAELDGLRPAQVPAFAASGTAIWELGPGTRVALSLAHQSARFEDDLNRRRLAPATTIDASARLVLRPGLALALEAENLADAVVETGFLGGAVERASPRTVWIGLAFGPQSGR